MHTVGHSLIWQLTPAFGFQAVEFTLFKEGAIFQSTYLLYQVKSVETQS